MIVVHAGNRTDAPGSTAVRFPDAAVAPVTARVAGLLDVLRPSIVVSAPAAGADLVVLGEAQRAGVAVHVLLPLAQHEFERRSVADRGECWVRRFYHVLETARGDAASTVEQLDLGHDPEWWRTANTALVSRASALAAPRRALALTIRPVGGETPPSGTDDFAGKAEAAGLAVVTIDPRPGRGTVVVG